MSESPYPPPQHQQQYSPAPMSPADERTWGMFSHLSAILASFIGLTFLGPLIVFLVHKDRSQFVRGHAGEALNMSISVTIYAIVLSVVGTILSLIGIGILLFVMLFAVCVVALVFAILAAVAANRGQVFRYPLIIRMVR